MIRIVEKEIFVELRYENIDFGGRYLITTQGKIFDQSKNEFIRILTSHPHGYPSVYLVDSNNSKHQLLLHRIMASTFIGSVSGMHVHHQNHNRTDIDLSNLIIENPHAHLIQHNRGECNSTAKLSNDDVHKICKMLCDGITHKKIAEMMSKKTRTTINVDVIDKIACGKNWTSISNQYNIQKHTRETMGEFSKKKTLIGRRLVVDGLTIRQLADSLGIEYGTKRYRRFAKCAKRYADEFRTKTRFIFSTPPNNISL